MALGGGEGEVKGRAAGGVLGAASGGELEGALLLGRRQVGAGSGLVGQLDDDAGAVGEEEVLSASQHLGRLRTWAA
jgi:hypothetical protein